MDAGRRPVDHHPDLCQCRHVIDFQKINFERQQGGNRPFPTDNARIEPYPPNTTSIQIGDHLQLWHPPILSSPFNAVSASTWQAFRYNAFFRFRISAIILLRCLAGNIHLNFSARSFGMDIMIFCNFSPLTFFKYNL